ncbi:17-beta-hydroxysteroid dehydrogenase type 2 [Hyperolius riggenbachi]|uniref:17-beta-hydroxysteroid dehydrogenase type 2 n=1 Tax=Hyperolius riggenbachi TaxID=752182 RepID=UPI0035A37029
MEGDPRDVTALYVALTALFSGLVIHKLAKNKVKIENASLWGLQSLMLLELFCYFVFPALLGAIIFIVACALYYVALPVREMLPTPGKTVLVTGCDSGFGHALAKYLDEQGVLVFAGVLDKNGPGAVELRRFCSSKLCLIQLDVTNSGEIEAAYQEINRQVQDSGLWGIVHNAGILGYAADGELLPVSFYKQSMEVNFFGVVGVTRMFLPLLRRSRGRLVAMCSLAGDCPIPGFAAYAATKAALSMFSAVMRQDLLKWGVKVSTIHPSGFKTNIFGSQEYLSSQTQKILESITPDVREDYGDDYLVALKDLHHEMFTTSSSDLSPVLEDVFHALLARHPHPSYSPGRFAYFIPCLFRYFPSWVYDTFSKKTFNYHRTILPKSLRISNNNNKTD